jgi:hypothetical protein
VKKGGAVGSVRKGVAVGSVKKKEGGWQSSHGDLMLGRCIMIGSVVF